jgi:hypothetical protein
MGSLCVSVCLCVCVCVCVCVCPWPSRVLQLLAWLLHTFELARKPGNGQWAVQGARCRPDSQFQKLSSERT